MTQISKEYRALLRRNMEPYSFGHRIMYDVPLTLMTRNERAKERFSILEVGFGIGWGLDRMIDLNVIDHYHGMEPDLESFDYVQKRHGKNNRLTLVNEKFVGIAGKTFDHVFCIEVIEHIPAIAHLAILNEIRASTHGTLWLSTPDKNRCPEHGVRDRNEWQQLLEMAAFDCVTHHTEQWTDLYICQ